MILELELLTGRNKIGGQWAPPPFNRLLSNPATPDGLPPGWTGNEMQVIERTPSQRDIAMAALLELAAPTTSLSVQPRSEQDAKEIALVEALSRLEDKLDILLGTKE